MDLLIESQRLPLACLLAGESPEGVALLLRSRRKQCALELLAVLKLLQERNQELLQEPESVLRSLSAATFAQIWSTPAAYLWTRVAYGFVHSSRQDATTTNFAKWLGITPDALLPHLIERLWLLVLAGLLIEGRRYQLPSPLPLPREGTLASLGLAWKATRRFQMVGVGPEGLILSDESSNLLTLAPGAPAPGLGVIRQPLLLENSGFYLDVWSEHALASFKGIEQSPRVKEAGALAAQAKVVGEALASIQQLLPGLHEEMTILLQTLTPLQPLHPGLPSSSNSAMTGAVWYTATHEPLLLAEMLIHEHSHNKLFLLQDIDPLVDPQHHGSGWEDCSYYSPWRDDPRPLNGIFHGYVVFSEAAHFWGCRLRQQLAETLSLRRFGMLVRQLQQARIVLQDHCSFTPAGAEVMRLLGERMDRVFLPLAEKLGTDRLPAMHMESNNVFAVDPNATIAAAVRSHRHQWEMRLASHAS